MTSHTTFFLNISYNICGHLNDNMFGGSFATVPSQSSRIESPKINLVGVKGSKVGEASSTRGLIYEVGVRISSIAEAISWAGGHRFDIIGSSFSLLGLK